MGSNRRKKGKNARRARQGLLGLTKTSTAVTAKKTKQYLKKSERRDKQKEEKQLLEQTLKETLHGKDVVIGKEPTKIQHSFVIHTGKVGRYIKYLERDLRQVMRPNTSRVLKVTKKNNFKDFLVNAQFLGVTHLLVLTRSVNLSVNLRVICNPQGPTLHFKVEKYSLARDILGLQKRPVIHETLFQTASLVVLDGFDDPKARHLYLVQTVFKHMFPSIEVDTVKLSSIKRVLLISYNEAEDLVQFRHYAIKSVPTGVSKSTKKLMQNKIPDLSKYEDISDFLLNPGVQSDSEFEGEQEEVVLPEDMGGRGKKKGQLTQIRLVEIGPRMTLKLVKIEEGVDSGEVLYHSFVTKTDGEIQDLRRATPKIRKKKLLHEKRVEHQTIRRLKGRAERVKKEEANSEELKQALISKQKEVTGDVVDEK